MASLTPKVPLGRAHQDSGAGGVGEVWVWKHVLAAFEHVDDAEAAATGVVPVAYAGEVVSRATSEEVRRP